MVHFEVTGDIRKYNAIKHENSDVTHVEMGWVQDNHYLEGGHHFKPEGHRLLAERLLRVVQGMLDQ